MGHVDHGKTSLADKIRGTAVAKREAGGITQMIGASFIPLETLHEICGDALEKICAKLKIPGILFIDTPGHEAFTNLRRRGGSIADIAVLVIDITNGIQPQTLETLEILKEYKTPFIIAANKIDLVDGWVDAGTTSFSLSLGRQRADVQAMLDEMLYKLVGRMHELGFVCDRFDRVGDFTKTVAIVPVSAKTGEGITELLMFLAGLTQKYMEGHLEVEVGGPGKGNILEVRGEHGLGTTIDVILYDGKITRGDEIIFGTLGGAKSTKVRALLKPKPLDEMRDPREKFSNIEEVYAASGVKIFAPGLEEAIAGSPVFVVKGNEEELKQEIEKEISEVLIESPGVGVILKADTLGSLEALTKLLAVSGIPVKRAGIGRIVRRDVMDALAVKNEDRFLGVILAFNIVVEEETEREARDNGVQIISDKIIYSLLDNYGAWVKKEKDAERALVFSSLVLPAKIKVLPGCCFRACKPAIFGIEVMVGRIRPGFEMINEKGESMGKIKAIQREKESVQEAGEGESVAVSMNEPVIGRSLKEGEVLYSNVPKAHYALLTEKYKELISEGERALLEQIKALTSGIRF